MLRSPAAMLPSRHLPHNPASSRQARRVDPLQVSCILSGLSFMAHFCCLKKLDLLCWCMIEAAKYLQLCRDVCLAPMFLVDLLDGIG